MLPIVQYLFLEIEVIKGALSKIFVLREHVVVRMSIYGSGSMQIPACSGSWQGGEGGRCTVSSGN